MKNQPTAIEPTKESDLLHIFQALGDPLRLNIVMCLLDTDGKGLKKEDYPIAKSTLSHHIKILREAGLIHCEKSGTAHYYSVQKAELNNKFPGLLELVRQEKIGKH